ncbi:MAG TPA: hypothetical protein ENI85_18860, partial [Deltaproteobacteria bacterium]|nr:hypothetical protein [Deltaproteobacteria bacterium]
MALVASVPGSARDPAIPPRPRELVAGQITEGNFETRRVGGPDSDGGIGDWFLGNGTLCAIVSSPDHESALTPQGGVLIDLGHCGAQNDQWTVLQPLMNLNQHEVIPVKEISARVERDRASIRTRAVHQGIEFLTTY